MKKSILISLIVLFFQTVCKAQEWSEWSDAACHSGLEYRVRLSPGGCGSTDNYKVEIRNNYNKRFVVSVKAEDSDGVMHQMGRFGVSPGGTNSNWTCFRKGARGSKIYFYDLLFEGSKPFEYAACDQ